MFGQAGESSGRGNGGGNSSSGGSGAAVTPGGSSKVAVSSVVGAVGAVPISNLDGADDGPGSGGATAS